ncbi:MAG: dihydropteroate synthase [Thermoleophilaceae bacterium]
MRLRLGGESIELERGCPLLMGIVNATPDSFSDRPGQRSLAELTDHALALVEAGAAIVDAGGESGRSDRPAVSEAEEIARVVPLVERLARRGVRVSVDTWRAGPARAALAAGATMVNDVSGLADPVLAELCAESGAGLVVTHTRLAPKTKGFPAYDDVVADVIELLGERARRARELGVGEEQLVLDPGLDLAKTPAQSIELLRRAGELAALGRPLLLAVSRKDFVGALTGSAPGARDPGTLGALEPALELPAAIVRVHDVAGASDFLRVRRALRGEEDPPEGPLDPSLRRSAAA